MTDLEQQLIDSCKVFMKTYDSLRNYRGTMLMFLEPEEKLAFFNAEREYVKIEKLVKDLEV